MSSAGARPLAISLGDPAGVGPEIVVRALAARPNADVCIFGDRVVLARTAVALGLPRIPDERVEPVTDDFPGTIVAGQPNHASAAAQVAYLDEAVTAVLDGRCTGLVTAPISKDQAAQAGFSFPGHTEYLAARSGTASFAMMLAGPDLRVTVATTHVALREVPERLSVAGIAETIRLTAEALARDFGFARPRVAVCGLNPHAGEVGRFGDEEARLVAPAIEGARDALARAGIDAAITGPAVPDAVFRQAAVDKLYDGVVALYHDQGLIPVKLLHFDEAVNVTLGLPFVRTSPDHGTAYDIAGRGVARETSFLAALDLASRLCALRTRR